MSGLDPERLERATQAIRELVQSDLTSINVHGDLAKTAIRAYLGDETPIFLTAEQREALRAGRHGPECGWLNVTKEGQCNCGLFSGRRKLLTTQKERGG